MSSNADMEPKNSSEERAELELLSITCLSRCPEKRSVNRVLRPEWPECAAYLNLPPNPCWTKALCLIQEGVHRRGEHVDSFLKHLHGGSSWLGNERRTLRAVAAILYDQECSGIPVSETIKTPFDLECPISGWFTTCFSISSLIERMLLIDYGLEVYPVNKGGIPESTSWTDRRAFWRGIDSFSRYLADFVHCCRLGHLPEKRKWSELGNILAGLYFVPFHTDVADLAIQLHYYHTHQRQLCPTECKTGVTGYTGILRELEDEVSLRGPARLMRKLSVDVNFFIPNYIRSSLRRKTLVDIAESIAARYGLCIVYLENGNFSSPAEKTQTNLPSYSPQSPR